MKGGQVRQPRMSTVWRSRSKAAVATLAKVLNPMEPRARAKRLSIVVRQTGREGGLVSAGSSIGSWCGGLSQFRGHDPDLHRAMRDPVMSPKHALDTTAGVRQCAQRLPWAARLASSPRCSGVSTSPQVCGRLNQRLRGLVGERQLAAAELLQGGAIDLRRQQSLPESLGLLPVLDHQRFQRFVGALSDGTNARPLVLVCAHPAQGPVQDGPGRSSCRTSAAWLLSKCGRPLSQTR